MASSPKSIDPKTETPSKEIPVSPSDPNSTENPKSEALNQELPKTEHEPNSEETDEVEEESECGFCLYMKAGGCKDSFVDWEKCVEEAEKNDEDIVEKCFQVTSALKKCMEVHSDYYAPLLDAEKAAEAEAIKYLDDEKAKERQEGVEGESSKGKEEGS